MSTQIVVKGKGKSSPKIAGKGKAPSVPGTGAGDEEREMKPRGTWEEQMAKVKRTIGWYNHNGGLQSPIHYQTVVSLVEQSPRDALRILGEMEEKAPTIRDPTQWFVRALENKGPQLDIQVRRAIATLNKSGLLAEEIKFDDVRPLLGQLATHDAMHIVQCMEGKEATITNPTAFICKAARNKVERDGPTAGMGGMGGSGQGGQWMWVDDGFSGPAGTSMSSFATGGKAAASGFGKGVSKGKGFPKGVMQSIQGKGKSKSMSTAAKFEGNLDDSVKKSIGWYNKNGGLQEQISFNDVAPVLAMIPVDQAMKILEDFGARAPTIRNPTGYIAKAANNLLGA